MSSTRLHDTFKSNAAVFLLLASLALASSSDSAPSIEWTKPVRDDVFGSGDTITGQWTVSDGSPVNAPSFKLCSAGDSGGSEGNQGTDDNGGTDSKSGSADGEGGTDDNPGDGSKGGGSGNSSNSSRRRRSDGGEGGSDASCGETVWPTVQDNSGSYSVSLAVPNVTSASGYYLQMIDDFGNKMNSPSFSLSPTPPSSSSSLPLSASDSASASASSSKPSHTQALDSPASTAPPSTSSVASSNSYPDLAAAHGPPPVAAFAIPLSIVGAILVAALVLGVVHYRKLKRERAKDAESVKSISIKDDEEYLSRRSSLLSDASRRSGEKMWDPDCVGTTYGEPARVWDGYAWGGRREPERRYATRQAFPEDHYTAPSYSRSVRASTPSSRSVRVPTAQYAPSVQPTFPSSRSYPMPNYSASSIPSSRSVPASAFRVSRMEQYPSMHHISRAPDLSVQDPCYGSYDGHGLIGHHSRSPNYQHPGFSIYNRDHVQPPAPPIPGSLLPSSPELRMGSPGVVQPERVFVRRGAPGGAEGDVYDRVTRMLYPR
ncbi:hypothetical protein OE88DRAFT_164414 [Heliocybe sulcata]|uniref:Mid2 domain-containing protein n=1 Tax=Heliocybe sulcata TaxID=5364 RepID=A0A5C3NMK6_9AGAM|nr:hypothetical protein OE88DRAFT_164414 [Heliocybe sulcata]